MADTKKTTEKVTNTTAKKTVKKVSTKAVAKPVAKKVGKKLAKKATKKPIAKKTTKKATKKAVKKNAKKVSKKTSKNASSKKDNRFEQLQSLLQDNLSGINADGAEALAKNIWLAGLGAYSKTFDEIAERVDDMQDRYSTINSEGQKIFQDLVKHGDSMQSDIEKTVKKGRDTLEDRVEDFKERFGGSLSSVVDIPGRLRQAAKKVDKLSNKLKKK